MANVGAGRLHACLRLLMKEVGREAAIVFIVVVMVGQVAPANSLYEQVRKVNENDSHYRSYWRF
jgi:hypothetical protein